MVLVTNYAGVDSVYTKVFGVANACLHKSKAVAI